MHDEEFDFSADDAAYVAWIDEQAERAGLAELEDRRAYLNWLDDNELADTPDNAEAYSDHLCTQWELRHDI